MKKGKHPEYRDVLFTDSSTGVQFVCGSTVPTEKVGTFEGKEYPELQVSISSASHPFFTGSKKFADMEGRVEKWMKRYGKGKQKKENTEEKKEEETK